ncbi:hypothetical protein CmeUKMEL1_09915 [Cryptosporidium meleagridis]|uniref:Uncharacterized protein n=1 Tax=Cryptosporidium meleagridis TaxID=93969 RepID=A0A2P4Z1J5_9CRYT|nr:hypothetical protein CmeUKMEL1_09915 [Cryptosporidium meleagridis]
MILQLTKVYILILFMLCIPLYNIDLYNSYLHFEQSFLKSNTKKFKPPQGSFNYLLPSNTPDGSLQPELQRSQSISTGSAHGGTRSNSQRRQNRSASETCSGEITTPNPIPFPLPNPDYDEGEFRNLVEKSRETRRSSNLHVVPPEVMLPEPDYETSHSERESRKPLNRRSATRRTLSRQFGFNFSNLFANQASYVARRAFSKDGKHEETVEEKVARRKSLSLSRETFSPIDEGKYIGKPFSTETPYNLVSECKHELSKLLNMIQKLNAEVRELTILKNLISNCSCGTKNCVMCQENFELYNSHKSEYHKLKPSIESKADFIRENCLTGQSNKYESASHKQQNKELFSLIYEQIIRKNRLYVNTLFHRCEIADITDRIIKKQLKCRKCKKKREVCKKHSNLLQKLREIEFNKNKSLLEIEQLMEMIHLKMGNLPRRMVQDIVRLEEQDEMFIRSHVKVKECMKKLSITSADMSGLEKIFKKNKSSAKKNPKRKSFSGSIATKASSSRTGFIGEASTSGREKTRTTSELPPSASSIPSSRRHPSNSNGEMLYETNKMSKAQSSRAASLSRRTPSGASRRTAVSASAKAHRGSQSSFPSHPANSMKSSSLGPYSAPESGAIPKVRSGSSRVSQKTSKPETAKRKSDHKKMGKNSRSEK